MSAPTVSVVMATYNHAAFVRDAIDSVLGQRGVDFEFIIADDGSADETREVVSSVRDSRIRFFPNVVNRGACIVTNELIQNASGEFIALINSDDFWIGDDKLAYQVDVLRNNPSIGACFGRARFVDKSGSFIDKDALAFGNIFDQENRSQGNWLRRFFDLGNCLCHPTIMIRRQCYEQLGLYDNRMRQLPDLDMWIRLVKRFGIFISEKELINFRILPGENASSQTPGNAIRTMNEHYFIARGFFDEVDRSLLLDGFQDLLRNKLLPSEIHVEIEKALLFLQPNQWLGGAYQLVGLSKLWDLLNDDNHRRVLISEYSIDDRWLQKLASEVNVLSAHTGYLTQIESLRESLNLASSQCAELAAIRASTSWRITAPLREVGTSLRSILGRK